MPFITYFEPFVNQKLDAIALYKVPEIAAALVAAINRGVKLRIIAETPDSDRAKIFSSVPLWPDGKFSIGP